MGKVFDGNTTAAIKNVVFGGIEDGDDVTLIALATFNDETVGTNKQITVEYTLSGTDAGNYTSPTNFVAKNRGITVTSKALPVTSQDLPLNKVYDGNATAANVVLSGVEDGDVGTVIAVANYDTNNVGTTKSITVSYSLSGANANSYTRPADFVTNNGGITSKVISDYFPVENKIYDGKTEAIVLTRILTGVISPGEVKLIGGEANFLDESTGRYYSKRLIVKLGLPAA